MATKRSSKLRRTSTKATRSARAKSAAKSKPATTRRAIPAVTRKPATAGTVAASNDAQPPRRKTAARSVGPRSKAADAATAEASGKSSVVTTAGRAPTVAADPAQVRLAKAVTTPSSPKERFTLAIDIGGTHIKASVLDGAGREMVARVELPTPRPSPPDAVLKAIGELVASLPAFDRISTGFPGVVVRGSIVTAPNLGTDAWHGFDLAAALTRRFGKPARVLNDAEVQGFGVIEGRGLECVVTLGTGFGSALYRDGELMPHLELGQHPIWKQKTYDEYIGIAALRKHGDAKWNRRVQHAINVVRTLLNYDHLYIGGGNAMRLDFALPVNVTKVSNEAGITGGVALWRPGLERMFSARPD